MKDSLIKKHPRLFFTKEDIPKIRERAKTTHKWFVDEMKRHFGMRVGAEPPKSLKEMKKERGEEQFGWGFWRLIAMDMFYLITEDEKYLNTAKKWVLKFCEYPDWGGDDLAPMDMCSGIAITYDWLYDKFTEDERRIIRKRLLKQIDFIYKEGFIGKKQGYWVHDFQNNHHHNRLHGFLISTFSIYGDDPQIDVSIYADFAYKECLELVKWLPEDGSNHEGIGYWAFGTHWLIRTLDCLNHVTGVNLLKHPYFKSTLYFKMYMTTPDLKNSFNIGDGGGGAGTYLCSLYRVISEFNDGYAQKFYNELRNKNPDAFFEPTWGLIYYNPEIKEKDYTELPLWRYFPDLELFSIRGSWTDESCLGFVIKCGPPGGYKLNKIRGDNWANVAHDHPDQNHFLIFAQGEMLAEDDGYPKKAKLTSNHNTIIIDGKGQPKEGEGWYQPFPMSKTGFVKDFFAEGKSAVFCGDASRCYEGIDKFLRYAFYVNGEYIVILDILESSKVHKYEWLLHKNGKWEEINDKTFRVVGNKSSLLIKFLLPDRLTYEFKPKALEAPPCISVSSSSNNMEFFTILVPENKKVIEGSKLLDSNSAFVSSIKTGSDIDIVCINKGKGSINIGEVSTDSTSFILRKLISDSKLKEFFALNCTNFIYSKLNYFISSIPVNVNLKFIENGCNATFDKQFNGKLEESKITLGCFAPKTVYLIKSNVENLSKELVTNDNGEISFDIKLSVRQNILFQKKLN